MTSDGATTHRQTGSDDDPTRQRRRRLAGWWILIVALGAALVVDQVSKELALHALLNGPITVGGVRLHLIANRGVLLGFPAPNWVVVVATVAVLIVALRSARQASWMTSLAFGLLAGGALGNLLDRFQDRHFFPSAAVVDWISAGRITFNLADVFVIAGVAMLVFIPTGPASSGSPEIAG